MELRAHSSTYDFIIVGSGIAGLYTALLARRHGRVLLLAKSDLDDTNTNHAQGGIAAAVGFDDRPELHWRDTLEAGAGLSDAVASWILASEAPARIDDLLAFGVPFDRENGQLALGREAAHCAPRVLHARGDGTGASIQETLSRLVRASANIDVREQHEVIEAVVSGGVARGVVATARNEQMPRRFDGRAVILATGGAGRLYERTTNPPVATGGGIALAYRAGASVADLEFCQFHPTALALPGAPRFLISEAARGEGGLLRNAKGHRFMPDYDPRAELAPRHIVANAIRAEAARLGVPHVYLDLSHLPAERVLHRFPGIAAFCRDFGLDITRSPIPVAPAAHYMMGGVRTDLWGRTDVAGLFACGEVACTGVHGGNRLASNSLLEGLVFGARIVRFLIGELSYGLDEALPRHLATECEPGLLEDYRWGPHPGEEEPRIPGDHRLAALPSLAEVQRLMWHNAGMERSRASLCEAAEKLTIWAQALERLSPGSRPLRDVVLVARLVVAAALARQESRGSHCRTDFPRSEPAWRRRLVYRQKTGVQSLGSLATISTS